MQLRSFINQYKFSILAVVFFSFALFFEKNVNIQISDYHRFEKAQKILDHKIKKVDKILEDIEYKLDSIELGDLMVDKKFLKEDLYKNEGIVILGYSADSLVYWSDNSIPVENYFVDNQLYSDVAKLKNGWFIIRQNYIDDYELFGLILVKNEYSYQNEFIRSDFFPGYEIDVNAKLEIDEDNGFNISDVNGNYLFSFVLDSNTNSNRIKAFVASFLYLLTLIFLFIGFRVFIKNHSGSFSKEVLLLILGVILVLIRYFMLKYHLPIVFKELDLFQPHHFAISFIVPSLGDLLIHAVFTFYFFFIFYETFELSFPKSKLSSYLVTISFIVSSFILFFYVNHFFESLILHSSISFEIYKFFDLSIYSLIGFIIVILLLASFFLFVDRIAQIVTKIFNLKHFIFLIAIIMLLTLLGLWLAKVQINPVSIVFLCKSFF